MYAATLTAARRIDRAAADAALHLTFVALVALVAAMFAPLALIGAAFYLSYCGLDWFMDGCMSDILGIAPPAGRIYGARDYDPRPDAEPDAEPAPETIPPVVAPVPPVPTVPTAPPADEAPAAPAAALDAAWDRLENDHSPIFTPDGMPLVVRAADVTHAYGRRKVTVPGYQPATMLDKVIGRVLYVRTPQGGLIPSHRYDAECR